jgi:hypothetical protein
VCKRVIERLADRCGSSVDDAGVALERVTQAVVVIAQEPADVVESDGVLVGVVGGPCGPCAPAQSKKRPSSVSSHVAPRQRP